MSVPNAVLFRHLSPRRDSGVFVVGGVLRRLEQEERAESCIVGERRPSDPRHTEPLAADLDPFSRPGRWPGDLRQRVPLGLWDEPEVEGGLGLRRLLQSRLRRTELERPNLVVECSDASLSSIELRLRVGESCLCLDPPFARVSSVVGKSRA